MAKAVQQKKTSQKKTTTKKNPSSNNNSNRKSSGKQPSSSISGSDILGEIILIAAIAFSCLMLFSIFTDATGALGYFLNRLLFGLFGIGAYILPFLLIAYFLFVLLKEKSAPTYKIVTASFLILTVVTFAQTLATSAPNYSGFTDFAKISFENGSANNGGMIGAIIANAFVKFLDKTGTYILLSAIFIICAILITGRSFFAELIKLYSAADKMRKPISDAINTQRQKTRMRPKQTILHTPVSPKSKPIIIDTTPASKKPFDFAKTEAEANEKKKSDSNKATATSTSEEISPLISGLSEQNKIPVINESAAADGIHIIDKASVTATVSENSKTPSLEEESDIIFSQPDPFIPKPLNKEPVIQKAIDKESAAKEHKSDTQQTDILFDLPSDTHELKNILTESNGSKTETKESAPKPALKNEYSFPSINFIKPAPPVSHSDSKEQMLKSAKKLEETLMSFGVDAKVVQINKGPTVTRYELSPKQGVKVSKIVNLADDIALNLAAAGIRIEAPIPGKAAVGIEVPNKEQQAVSLREVIGDQEFINFSSKVAFAVGKDIAGMPVVADIAKMPHLMIAGATGSGKSVCINTLITSILYKAHPDEVKLLMIDPKVVELSVYNGIPHLLIPVVTDAKKAAGALNWAVTEMVNRYKSFAEYNVRDMKGFNNAKHELGEDGLLPQIVIIIDELADLMMASPKEVEESICRLAQMARAAGLHLIIATQRPSVDVITGVIKANIPSRLAFSVSSGTDSRTILDMVGAEKLLGKGDMLFYPVGMSKPVRIQGAFISDKEVETIVQHLKSQVVVEHDPKMVETITSAGKGMDASGDGDDEFSDEAIAFIVQKEKASVSMLQRQFRIGYNRAARLMEQLEQRGIVGPEDGSKPRKVLMTKREFEEWKGLTL